ncbi:MAG TPA: phosphoribosyltransferase family protein [Candidatus Dormibacteraeota bacterium]|nr:phosphoribosyltransferase family protein [Candidatus Dormibacteraeota bacterium]
MKAATVYDGISKNLIWKLKLAGARAAAHIMAERLAPLVERTTETIIVPVPTATGRARQRGYDQARLLARELARGARLPYRDCLARHGQTHQHGLPRRERLAQLAGTFRVTRRQAVPGAHIILVDDVVTTGATLEAAAAVLRAGGAARIDAVTFAQPNPSGSYPLQHQNNTD